MSYEQWIPRILSAPPGPKMIQFSADGTVWETWTPPYDPDALLTTIKAVISSVADESPKRRIPLLFTAFAEDGTIWSQCPSSVMGRNAQADAIAGSGGGAAKAFSEAMTGQASLMNTMLKAAENLVVYVTKVNESLTEQVCDLRDYQKAKQDLELLEQGANSGMSEFVMQQLKDASPLALEAASLFLESHKKSIAERSANAVKTVTNGAKS